MFLIYIIIAVFTLTVVTGIFLINFAAKNNRIPLPASFVHTCLLGLVIILLFMHAGKYPGFTKSILLFCASAIAWIFFMANVLTGKRAPKWLAVVYSVLALAGFTLMVKTAFYE